MGNGTTTIVALGKTMKWHCNSILVLALLASIDVVATEPDCSLCFYGPDNMAIDREGNVYIADTNHGDLSRVLKLSKSGEKLAEWSGFRNVPGHSNGPEGIALAPNGDLMVTDGGALNIIVLSKNLLFLRVVGGDATFHDLGHVAVDSAGQLYVAEGEQNRIQKFSAKGVHVATWQMTRGNALTDLNTPQGIGMLPDGHLAVEDWRNRRIVILDASTGSLLFAFGGVGREPGRFLNTSGLYVDRQGNLWVAEQQLHRLQKFNARGKLLAVIGNTPGAQLFTDGPSAIAIDADDNLLAPDGLSIVKLSQDGHILERWR